MRTHVCVYPLFGRFSKKIFPSHNSRSYSFIGISLTESDIKNSCLLIQIKLHRKIKKMKIKKMGEGGKIRAAANEFGRSIAARAAAWRETRIVTLLIHP
jgi:hypothetical protein